MKFGSLFSGIGGIDLGLERAGMECVWQVERDEFCLKVLCQHWPDIPKWNDVRTFPPKGDWSVDLIAGGFPCQDISQSNPNGEGLKGKRSGLWHEYYRIICVLRPRYILIENVSAITFRGLDTILCQLAAARYDAEWQIIPVNAFGGPHQRERLFLVAYTTSERGKADAIFQGFPYQTSESKHQARQRWWPGRLESGGALPNRVRWCPDSKLCRVADGVPDELDRYRGLGNAVVPQIAQWIGEQIMRFEGNSNA